MSAGPRPGKRRARQATLAAVIVAIGAMTSACSSAGAPSGGDRGTADREVVAPSGPRVEPEVVTVGTSVEGRAILAQEFGDGPEVVLIMATIHGNEAAGTPLLEQLADHLAVTPSLLRGRRVVLIPVANPDGYAARRRTNQRGVDLNRNFPAGNFSESSRHGDRALSEPESRALHDFLLRYRPTRVVSIHQPLACIDYDGPALELATTLARESDLPVKKLGARPGSLGAFLGNDLGIPTITLELPSDQKLGPGVATNGEALWKRYGALLLAAIGGPMPIRSLA